MAFLLRQSRPAFQNSLLSTSTLAIRGPKKKKGGPKVEAPDSNDIVNIYKDREDAKIYSSDRYPPWLMRMLAEQYTPDDIVL